jgi:probable rRNA maturation factor
MQIEVTVQDCAAQFPIAVTEATWQQWFECWLNLLSPTLSPAHSYELSLRLTDDAEIQQLNAQYRQQNRPTDVLSFAALEVDTPQSPDLLSSQPLYLGDLIISVETAIRQADRQGHPLITELAWLSVHGLLHLLGWDHPDDQSLARMLAQQDQLLAAVALPPVGQVSETRLSF